MEFRTSTSTSSSPLSSSKRKQWHAADRHENSLDELDGGHQSEGTQTASTASDLGRSISSGDGTGDFGVKSHRFWRALKRVFAKEKIDDALTDTSSSPKEEEKQKNAQVGIEPAPFDDELSVGDEVPLDDRVYDPDDVISCLSAFSDPSPAR